MRRWVRLYDMVQRTLSGGPCTVRLYAVNAGVRFYLGVSILHQTSKEAFKSYHFCMKEPCHGRIVLPDSPRHSSRQPWLR